MKIQPSKWLTGVALGATMMMALVACGGDDPTPAPAASAPAAAAPTATPKPAPTATPRPVERKPAATATPTSSEAAAPAAPAISFEGKTIRIVANSSPGGGTDTQGRVMAAFMSKYIPGNPRVVFTNQPNKPLEYLYAATEAPTDGTYVSWNSTPQLAFGFEEDTKYIKRSTFQALGSTIDPTRSWMTYDPTGNLGADAATKCLADFSGMSSTGGGDHGQFLLADEISDISEGNPTFLASVYASEQLDIPFRYFAFDTVDTNAVKTMWARGDINSTVRSSLWYRFPVEHPDWIPSGLMRSYAGMGPGTLRANAQTEPHCPDVRDALNDEQDNVFNSMMGPTNYASKSLWLPPGTSDEIADAMSAAFEKALTTDKDLISKYAGVAGEEPGWMDRKALGDATKENEALLQGSAAIIEEQKNRLLSKFFPQYLGG